jgi:hypothetical protein
MKAAGMATSKYQVTGAGAGAKRPRRLSVTNDADGTMHIQDLSFVPREVPLSGPSGVFKLP